MVRLQDAVLPQSSVAVHVLATLYVPGQVPGVVTSEKVIVTLGSQVSVAVGGVNTGTAGQLIGVV
jgi:prefoldin subunit 5